MARKKNIAEDESSQEQQPPTQHHHQHNTHQHQSRHAQQHRSNNRHGHSRKNNNSYLEDDYNYPSFLMQLEQLGLEIRDIPGDGNCLFRALGDQLEGSDALHLKHRADVVQYMLAHKDDFAPFVDDSTSFEDYVRELARPGTYAGNDAIVAFARLHKLNIVIHQLASPPWQIGGSGASGTSDNATDSVVMPTQPSNKQLHLAYHNGEHYSSIRRLGDRSATPANVSIKFDQQTASISGSNKSALSAAAAVAASTSSMPEPSAAELNTLVSEVVNRTGCNDVDLIAESLRELQFDLDETAAYVFQVLESVVNDEASVGANPSTLVLEQQLEQHQLQQHRQRTKPTKREAKLLKKERATERHRRMQLQSGDDADTDETGAASALMIQAGSPLLQL
ncbi:hypothetical protein BOX15_Mlig013207g1 [Macrostomum lignano]|uniref:OTU domain-containing protein n=1 Tax=Macrostomum lignano TaxID=282301 RepID=A0A267E112_9PLAT|nr:hypothetical protein BOX15_Mlig013207g1 [Macrostomum lignano]